MKARWSIGLWLGMGVMPQDALPQDRVSVAQGEFVEREEVRAGNSSDTFESRNTWTLWRLKEGGFEVEEKIRSVWGNPGIAPRTVHQRIRLSGDLHPERFESREGDTTTLSCAFHRSEARCNFDGKEISQQVDTPYDLYGWSPWFFASAVRRASADSETNLRLLLIDRPPGMGLFEGTARRLGTESWTINGRQVSATKYQLRTPLRTPALEVWVSEQKIPLGYGAAGAPRRLELVRFEIR